MSYFIFDQDAPLDVFRFTHPIERLGNFTRRVGFAFEETKGFSPQELALFIERDIIQDIKNDELPNLKFSVSVERTNPVPMLKISINDVREPIVFRGVLNGEAGRDYEDSSIGPLKPTKLAKYIRRKIAQNVWRYNADCVSPRGIYGHTHFSYVIAYSPSLIERQIVSFNIANKKIKKKTLENVIFKTLDDRKKRSRKNEPYLSLPFA